MALVGAPNAGKSTLLNNIVGEKISIVTHKVQTTRTLLRGIALINATQAVFVDTPGIFAPKNQLDRAMVDAAWSGAVDADVIALILDVKKGIDPAAIALLDQIARIKRSAVLILNKIDLIKREALLALAAEANRRAPFRATFMISALTGSGVKDFLRFLENELPEGPWLYPEDMVSDLPMRMLAAEITREKILLRLHDELPYLSTVETDRWIENEKSIRIEQTIHVERESHKKIFLGASGQTIKAISMAARKELQEILKKKIHLFLFVKVSENWRNKPERYQEMGLTFPSRR